MTNSWRLISCNLAVILHGRSLKIICVFPVTVEPIQSEFIWFGTWSRLAQKLSRHCSIAVSSVSIIWLSSYIVTLWRILSTRSPAPVLWLCWCLPCRVWFVENVITKALHYTVECRKESNSVEASRMHVDDDYISDHILCWICCPWSSCISAWLPLKLSDRFILVRLLCRYRIVRRPVEKAEE